MKNIFLRYLYYSSFTWYLSSILCENTIHALIKFTGEVLDMDAFFQSHVICRQIFCNLLKINPSDIPNGITQNCSITGFWIKDLRIQRSQILTKNWKKVSVKWGIKWVSSTNHCSMAPQTKHLTNLMCAVLRENFFARLV